MSEAEREAAWDQKFYSSLGEFDERLAREQAEIEKQRSAANAGHGTGGAAGEGEAGMGGSDGTPTEVGADGGQTGSGDAQSSAAGGRGQAGSGGARFPAPEGVPDGRDDDVVARQLREAAETEKDPELRKRLWEEYRKYKSGKS